MPAALAEAIKSVSAKVVVLSFSNEGFVPLENLEYIVLSGPTEEIEQMVAAVPAN